MTNPTATELVDLVEAHCKADDGEGWDYPLVIDRLNEIADKIADGEGWLVPRLLPDDVPMLRGLAQVLTEALDAASDSTISLGTLSVAINELCSCGGKGPNDEGVCVACRVWHRVGGHLG